MDHARYAAAVREAHASRDVRVVITEGFQAFHDPSLVDQMDLTVWLDVGEETARERRMRTSPVEPDYFDTKLWPSHLEYRSRALLNTPSAVRLDGEADGEAAVAVVSAKLHQMLTLPKLPPEPHTTPTTAAVRSTGAIGWLREAIVGWWVRAGVDGCSASAANDSPERRANVR